MKDITVTKHGLRIEGRPILPGSRLISNADFPAHFSRLAEPTTGAAEPERKLEVATPDPELEAAREEYTELFGRKPNGKMLLENIRTAIDEKLAE